MDNKPLSGFRILELSDGVSASLAGRLLAYLGAELIKLVPSPAAATDDPFSYYCDLGKTFLALDPKSAAGAEDLKKLLRTANAFLTDLSLEALEDMGLSYGDLKAEYPALVYGCLEGLEAGTEGLGLQEDTLAYLARGGFLLDLHEPGAAPNRAMLHSGDSNNALILAAGVIAGLYKQLFTKEGSYIATSLLSTAVWIGAMHTILTQYGFVFPRSYKDPAASALSANYLCKDQQWVVFVVSSDPLNDWNQLVTALERPDLLEDPRFNTAAKQHENAALAEAVLAEEIAKLSYEELRQRLVKTRLTYERVQRLTEVPQDPQAQANGYFFSREQKDVGPLYYATAPIKMTELAVEKADWKAEFSNLDKLLTAAPVSSQPVSGAGYKKPLSGVRVVDLTTYLAAPSCTRILAYLGADVIKIEPPKGDPWRNLGKVYEIPSDDETNALFAAGNSGKRFLSLDLKSEEGQKILHKLLGTADIFITNMLDRTLDKLGIDYESLKARYPALVYGRIIGYGVEGAEARRPGFDATAYLARGGLMLDFVEPGTPPNNFMFGAGDLVTSLSLTAGILGGLMRRARFGMGARIICSLFHSAVWSGGLSSIQAQLQLPDRLLPAFRAEDGLYLQTDVESEGDLQDLYERLGDEVPKDDPDPIHALQEAFEKHEAEHWIRRFREGSVRVEILKHVRELPFDPQVRKHGFMPAYQGKVGQAVYVAAPPLCCDRQAHTIEPRFQQGLDSETILRELGYSDAQMESFAANRVVKLFSSKEV